MGRRVWVVVLVLALGPACFEDGFINAGEKDTPSGEKKRFIEAVDPTCFEVNERIEALGRPADPAARLAALRQSVTIRQEQLDFMRAQDAPGGVDGLKFQAFVGALQNLTSALEGTVFALERGDRAAADRLRGDVGLAVNQAEEAAAEFLFEDCRVIEGEELASAG